MTKAGLAREAIQTVLVIHDKPGDLRAMLEGGFPDIRFIYAAREAEVAPALRSGAPQAVLSLKHSGFPGEMHRPAILYPTVRWFHVGGSGYEHIRPWDAERVTVTNSAGVLARCLAETVTGAMLALNGNLHRYIAQQREKVWKPLAYRSLEGQTLLIVGLGVIGRFVADNAKALGMHVLATRRTATPHAAVDELHPMGALAEIIGRADIVSIHLRLNDETRRLIDAKVLRAMKAGAMFINTSRGPIIDESALIEVLQSGHIGGAYLDVFETEPLPASSSLWDMPNVLLTPHASDNVGDWPRRITRMFIDNLERWRQGEPLLNEVKP